MQKYLLKRLLLFIPALLFVSLLVFALSKAIPGDPAQKYGFVNENTFDEQTYQSAVKRMGLDKPAFYFSISSQAFPDSLHKIIRNSRRDNLSLLINKHGNWSAIEQYYHHLLSLEKNIQNTADSLHNDDFIEVRRVASQLFIQHKNEEIERLFGLLTTTISKSSFSNSKLKEGINAAQHSFTNILNTESIWRLYVPDIKWRGMDNQYHNWISNFFKGDFGISYDDGRPIVTKIKEALYWTLTMNLFALLIIFSISIPLGIYLASKKGKRVDRYISIVLFALFSLPVFWVATLLLVFFTTPEYGQWLDLFPGPGLGELRTTAPFWDRFFERSSHLILPIFCLSFGGTAFVTRQIRGSMIDVLDQDFVRTARAKGLKEKTVLWRHAFRNALFPLISLMAMTIPGLLAGAVVVEFIFAIPGMGRLMFNSILEQDWPFVYTVLILTAILTMIANLLGDICFALADPRVRY